MEIFNHWWEYFLTMWWGISPPNLEKYFGPKPRSLAHFKDEHYDNIKALSKEKLNFLLNKIFRIEEQENKTTDTIENKANSILAQSGLIITLLTVAISLFTTKLINIKFEILIWFSLFLVFIIINLIVSALLAKNVLVTKFQYMKSTIENIETDSDITETIIEKICIVSHLNYINIIKASFVQFSYWYYKVTLCLVLFFIITLPVFYFLYNPGDSQFKENEKIIINNYSETDTTKTYNITNKIQNNSDVVK